MMYSSEKHFVNIEVFSLQVDMMVHFTITLLCYYADKFNYIDFMQLSHLEWNKAA